MAPKKKNLFCQREMNTEHRSHVNGNVGLPLVARTAVQTRSSSTTKMRGCGVVHIGVDHLRGGMSRQARPKFVDGFGSMEPAPRDTQKSDDVDVRKDVDIFRGHFAQESRFEVLADMG